MIFIVGQEGYTYWGFQIGRLYLEVLKRKYWRTSGIGNVLHFGWDTTDDV